MYHTRRVTYDNKEEDEPQSPEICLEERFQGPYEDGKDMAFGARTSNKTRCVHRKIEPKIGSWQKCE